VDKGDHGLAEALLYWGLGLLAVSLLLVAMEVMLPTGGALGALSLVAAVVGLVCLFRHDWRWGVAGLMAVLVLGPTAAYLGVQMLPSTPWGKKLLNEPPRDDGPTGPNLAALVGREAQAVTDLRPGGFVKFTGGEGAGLGRVPAMSEIAFIKSGTRVRVVSADGLQVRVRPVEA
jgi:membrane-bound ClpP family serine protease